MKRIRRLAAMPAGAWAAFGTEYVDFGVSVTRCIEKLIPVYTHGKISGIKGCLLIDAPRTAFAEKNSRSVSGEECFKLDVNPAGEATLSFPSPLPAPYAKKPADALRPGFCIDPAVSAPAFHIPGRVNWTRGSYASLPAKGSRQSPAGRKWITTGNSAQC